MGSCCSARICSILCKPCAAAGRFSKNIGGKLLRLVKRIVDFVRRHAKVFILYPLLAVAMAFAGAGISFIALHLLPGFGWNLMMSSGSDLVGDFIERVDEREGSTWVPENQDEAPGEALQKRHEQIKKIYQQLNFQAPRGWTMLYGKSGVGKSSTLDAVGRQLAKNGRAVYRLHSTKILKSGPVRGFIDHRFHKVATYLNLIALKTGVAPILIIDEFQRMVDRNSPGFNDCFKDSSHFPLRFNILAATTTQDRERIRDNDGALLTRFDGTNYELKPLDKEGIIKTLVEVGKKRFEGKVSRDILEHTADKVVKSKLSPNRHFKRVVTLLSKASELADESVNQKGIDEMIKLHSWPDANLAG